MRNAVTVAVLMLVCSAALAEDRPNNNAVSFGFGASASDLSVRHYFGKTAVLARFGYGQVTSEYRQEGQPIVGGDNTSTEVGLALRRYFGVRPFTPFVHGEVFYSRLDVGCTTNLSAVSFAGAGGVEYRFVDRLSIEGMGGLERTSSDTGCSRAGTPGTYYYPRQRTLGTFRTAIGLNFHF